MNCYFCSNAAQGQCQGCGRFICRLHSDILGNKLNCLQCYYKEQANPLFQHARKILLNAPKAGSCAICGKIILQTTDDKLGLGNIYWELSIEDRRSLTNEFSHSLPLCPIGCLNCNDHYHTWDKKDEDHFFGQTYYYTCKVCGHQWSNTVPWRSD